jgi:hypothetical protein
MTTIIKRKATREAEAKFEKYVNGETNGFNALVETTWAEAKSAFENHEDESGYGVFDFHVPAKDHPEITVAHVTDVLLTMDDFKDDIDRVQVMKQGKDDEARFEISIVYGSLRDREYDDLVAAHRNKKRRIGATLKKEDAKKEEEDEMERELAIEREMEEKAEAEEAALNAMLTDAEEMNESSQAEVDGTLSGYPDDGTTPENATFEALLKAGTLQLKLVDRPGHAPDQAVEPGPKGRKSDVFEHKELFKKCNPRFFFNGDAKEWRRTAPEGWTGMPPVVAAA